MCGIAGVISKDPKNSIYTLIDAVTHRGPDDAGVFINEKIGLGHKRLSIQDLSVNGHQPMVSFDKRYVLIFNGEIYNHWDIRKEIENKYPFQSTSDTETVLYGFIEYGFNLLEKLNGIFAFAIFDNVTDELTIARDQFGIKPIYLYSDQDKFLFSSEIKSMKTLAIDKEINEEAIANYLTFLWCPGKATPFKQVTKLLPGHYLHFNLKDFHKAKQTKYYQIPFSGIYSSKTENELVQELEQKLITAVKRQLLSDVPVGFFLSGGLDSSLIVAIARRLFPDTKLPCFTIETRFKESSEGFSDDLFYAKKVADHLNVDLNILKADVDILKDFDKMIWHLDEPQADAAPLNVLNICRYARSKGIVVLLGGSAGDDLFSGYRRHQAINLEKIFKWIPHVAKKGIKNGLGIFSGTSPVIRRLKKLTNDIEKDTYRRLGGYFAWLSYEDLIPLMQAEWARKLNTYNPINNLINLNKDIPEEHNLLNQMLYWEMKSFLVDHNLNYTDKLSMAVGVEVRVPYLDLELVEFSCRIPPSLKMKGSETKYILKKVAEKYLPHDVIYRPKTGFGAPVRKWITEDLNDMIKDYLSVSQLKKRGIFNPENVWQLIDNNKKGKIDASYPIWSLLAIESWMRQFVDKQ